MSARRSLSWSAALRDLRADRQPADERRAYLATVHAARIEALRAERGARCALWTAAGGFDRRAIMAAAVADARCIRFGSLARGCWRTALSVALQDAWAAAHAARRAGSH